MKKVLSLILAMAMLLSLCSVSVFADESEGTKENPYYVPMPAALPQQLELAPGASVYYQFPSLKFAGWNLAVWNVTGVEVNGVMNTEISLMDRCIKIVLSEEGDLVGFFNETEEAVTVDLVLTQPIGSQDDPLELMDGGNAITIPDSYPQYYAVYLPTISADFIVEISNYEEFTIIVDTDGDLSTTEDQVAMTEDKAFACESYVPLHFIITPTGGNADINVSVTPPKKGSATNPYWLNSYDEIVLGVDGLGDALWPTSPVGTCYTLYGLENNTLVVEYPGTANLMLNDVEYVIDGRTEIPLVLSEDCFFFEAVFTTAEEGFVKLDVLFPVGTIENPQTLDKGKNTLPLSDSGESYYASYVAEKDGVLLMTPHTVNGLGYTEATNATTGEYDFIFAGYEFEDGVLEGASDDNVITLAVSKGDVITVSACAGENEDFEILAMDLVLTVAYEGESTIEIITQPKTSTYGKDGATVKVTVKATGDGLKYQWYIKNAGSSKYTKSSITSATYSVKMSASSHDRRLYCVITDKNGNEVKTNTVLVRRQATITKESATVKYAQLNEKAAVKVTAVGEGLKYTWYVKNAGASKYSKSSITKASYSVTMTDKVKDRRIYCVVTDKYGKKVQSKTFILRMAASISTQPKTVTVKKNATAKVTLKAKGDGLKYTWYVKNEGAKKYSKSSITKSSYSVKMTSKVKNRLVYVVVKDKYGNTVKSKTVRLKMK